MRSLISVFVVHCLDSIIPLLAKSKFSRLLLVSVAEQAGLSLTWSGNPKTGFLVTWLICDLLSVSTDYNHDMAQVSPRNQDLKVHSTMGMMSTITTPASLIKVTLNHIMPIGI